jgi:hypothetical protein
MLTYVPRRSLTKIGIFDSTSGASSGYLYVFGDNMRNTTTEPSTFQYTKPTQAGAKFDLEFSIQVRPSSSGYPWRSLIRFFFYS